MITSLGFKAKVRPHKYKRERYAIRDVSKKYLSKIIRDFDKLLYKIYENKRPKHEPTDSYFYLESHFAKCMMRSDALNSYVYPVRTEMTAPPLHVCSTDKDESKGIIVHKTLSQSCSTEEDELCSVEECKSECTITEQKYKKSEVTYDVSKYLNIFNVFECRRKFLDRLDVSYKRAYMAPQKEEYF